MKNTLKTKAFVLKLVELLDETVCRKLLFNLARGPLCRYCRKSVPERHLKRFYAGKEVYCRQCNSRFYAVSGTVLAQNKLSYRQILKILVMADLEFKTEFIATSVGVERHTISRWRQKLKEL